MARVAWPIVGLFTCLLWTPALAADAARNFERAVKSRNSAAMVAAAERLADEPSKKGVKALVKYGALIEDFEVYVACRDALSACKQGDAREELLKALNKSKRPEQRVLCIDGLAGAGDAEAVGAVAGVLSDRAKPVRIAAIRALIRMQHRDGVPPLFQRLAEVGFQSGDAEAQELYDALHRLTGQALETLEDWQKFWETAGPDFDPKTRAATGDEQSTRMREGEGKIFGSVVRSQAFVLCLDISSSMRVVDLPAGETWTDSAGKTHPYKDPDPTAAKPPHPESRFARTRNAFVEFIEGLSARAKFSIVVFGMAKDTRKWKEEVVQATPKMKRDAIAFVKSLKWSAATRTDLAMEQAFTVDGADSIYLFSDGIPERRDRGKAQDIPQDEILSKVRALNRTRKLRVNCYGIAGSKTMRDFLRRLAEENDGEYQDIR